MTNYEKIKQMSVEEMARLMYNITGDVNCGRCKGYNYCKFFTSHDECEKSIKKWLESECIEQSVEKEIIEF